VSFEIYDDLLPADKREEFRRAWTSQEVVTEPVLSALTYDYGYAEEDCHNPRIHVAGDLDCTGESTPTSITIAWSSAHVLSCEDQEILITGRPHIFSGGDWVDVTADGTWLMFGSPNIFRIEGLTPGTLYQIRVIFTHSNAQNNGAYDFTSCFTSPPNTYHNTMFGGIVGGGSAIAGIAYSNTMSGGVVGGGEAWAQHGIPVGLGSVRVGSSAVPSTVITPEIASAGAEVGGTAAVPVYHKLSMTGGAVVGDPLRHYTRAITIAADKVESALDKYLLSVALIIPATRIGDPESVFFTSASGARLAHDFRSYDSTTGLYLAVVKTPLSDSIDTTIFINYGAL